MLTITKINYKTPLKKQNKTENKTKFFKHPVLFPPIKISSLKKNISSLHKPTDIDRKKHERAI